MDIYETITSIGAELIRAVIIDVVSEHVGRHLGRMLARREARRRRTFYAGISRKRQGRLLHELYTEVDRDAPQA